MANAIATLENNALGWMQLDAVHIYNQLLQWIPVVKRLEAEQIVKKLLDF